MPKITDSPFQMAAKLNASAARISIEMPRAELDSVASVMNDKQAMAPICKVVDSSPLGRALSGSTYCASDGNQYYQFKAKNWVSAFFKALAHFPTGFSLGKGKCPK